MENKNEFENKESEPKLEILFSKDFEVNRVNKTIKDYPWLKEHGYTKWLKLPTDISETSNVEDVSAAVSLEFDNEFYKKYADYIEKELPNIEKKLEILKSIKSFDLKDSYIIRLTKYGTGGSYHYDSKKGEVILNVNTDELIGSIVHEIIHIGIEELIKKYNVKHWHKERIVGLISEKLFPGLKKLRKTKESVSNIDAVFDYFFPDVEAIIKSIGEKEKNDIS